MAKYIHLIGTAKWAKVHTPDDKYEKYSICLYPTEGSWEAFNKSGIQVKIREDSDGKYVQFSRPIRKFYANETKEMGPPRVLKFNKESEVYEPFDGLIGNGSLVNVKIQYFETKRGVGHTLEAVGVEELVEYNPDGESSEHFPF